MSKRSLLITGAAGRIGTFLTQQLLPELNDDYTLVLADVRRPEETHGFPFTEADIADLDAMRRLCQGIDTVIHLAADPSPYAEWESLLPKNVTGVYNIFQAAHEAGCRRVIFASSVNAVSGYPEDVQVHTQMPVSPPNLYGATKAWGEAVAAYYANAHGLSAICLRFGGVVTRERVMEMEANHPNLSLILTLNDLTRLIAASIRTDKHFGVYHGLSNNRHKRLDISDARRDLGYDPQDDAFVIAGAGD
jgi:NAD+ dependent glucose-6-phosphate dehydrogenase